MDDIRACSAAARAEIMARVRGGLGRRGEDARLAAERVSAAIAHPCPGPRPPLEGDPVARFIAASERMSSSVAVVDTMNEVPAAIAAWLAENALATKGVVWPALAGLDWAGAGLALESRPVREDDPVGVTGCVCAIAETGTLMCASSPDTPSATSLLPETHVAVVPASRIVTGMEEAWALARAEWGARLPRAVNFISGPSRTGDIEMSIVLGAHGPYRVHILVVSGA
jgi:L-lactate dehydrogenase complex protein LldG